MKIVFNCGPSHEKWTPKSIKTGIGGSEEAVINITKELTKLGHDVQVYNMCDEGTYGGVKYIDYKKYNSPKCDVEIFWRSPMVLGKQIIASKAKKKYLWLHDTIPEHEILPYIHVLDKVMVLSSYHSNLYPHISQDKLWLTQNGVDLTLFNQKIKRNPKKIIWTSSYDRGLKELLEMWTSIKLSEPDAELHVFYGWNTMEKAMGKEYQFKIFKEMIEQLLDQEGVYHHGRVGQDELAKEFLSAGVWAYPTWWPEISCISAMKAQIGGAIPVVIPTAALAETVRWGYTTNWSKDHFNEIPDNVFDTFSDLVVEALDEKNQKKIREQMVKDARKRFDWATVAKLWEDKFKEEHENK